MKVLITEDVNYRTMIAFIDDTDFFANRNLSQQNMQNMINTHRRLCETTRECI